MNLHRMMRIYMHRQTRWRLCISRLTVLFMNLAATALSLALLVTLRELTTTKVIRK